MTKRAKELGTVVATIIIPILAAVLVAFFALGDMKWAPKKAYANEAVVMLHDASIKTLCEDADDAKKERRSTKSITMRRISKVEDKHTEDMAEVKPALSSMNTKLEILMDHLKVPERARRRRDDDER